MISMAFRDSQWATATGFWGTGMMLVMGPPGPPANPTGLCTNSELCAVSPSFLQPRSQLVANSGHGHHVGASMAMGVSQ